MIILKVQCKKNQVKDFATPYQAGLGEIFYRNWSCSPWSPVSLGTEDMPLKELATSSRKINKRPWTLSGFMFILSLTFFWPPPLQSLPHQGTFLLSILKTFRKAGKKGCFKHCLLSALQIPRRQEVQKALTPSRKERDRKTERLKHKRSSFLLNIFEAETKSKLISQYITLLLKQIGRKFCLSPCCSGPCNQQSQNMEGITTHKCVHEFVWINKGNRGFLGGTSDQGSVCQLKKPWFDP